MHHYGLIVILIPSVNGRGRADGGDENRRRLIAVARHVAALTFGSTALFSNAPRSAMSRGITKLSILAFGLEVQSRIAEAMSAPIAE